MNRLIPFISGLMLILVACSPVKNRMNTNILPSWTDQEAKKEILSFIDRVTDSTSAGFVRKEDRIATFDNDGTLLCEKPFWFGDYFAFEKIKKIASSHPGWKNRQPWKAVIEGDTNYLVKMPYSEEDELIGCAEAGCTAEQITTDAAGYFMTAKDKHFQRSIADLYYQPMIELLQYLESKGFRNYVVTGGYAELIRGISMKDYHIPSERVIGSHFQYAFSDSTGHAEVIIKPENLMMDIENKKAENIAFIIGKRPVIAAGNSNGDLAMLEYSQGRTGPSLQLLVHHDDPLREYSYDEGAEKALKEAAPHKWIVVSMKNDWKMIFNK